MVVKRLIKAYAIRDMTVCSLIRQDSGYKKMTLDDVLGRIINHEMFQEEANYVKNLSKDKSLHLRQTRRVRANK
jgi:hypothetical protein